MKRYLTLLLLSLPAVAFAHPGHDQTQFTLGIWSGFLHPLMGLDHLLALLAVGVMAARVSGKQGLLLAGGFLTMMLVGFLAGHMGIHGVAAGTIETLIVTSIIAGGVFVLMGSWLKQKKVISGIGSLVMSGFAIFHGLAHGIEVPTQAGAGGFAIGFTLACALVMTVCALSAQKMRNKKAVQA